MCVSQSRKAGRERIIFIYFALSSIPIESRAAVLVTAARVSVLFPPCEKVFRTMRLTRWEPALLPPPRWSFSQSGPALGGPFGRRSSRHSRLAAYKTEREDYTFMERWRSLTLLRPCRSAKGHHAHTPPLSFILYRFLQRSPLRERERERGAFPHAAYNWSIRKSWWSRALEHLYTVMYIYINRFVILSRTLLFFISFLSSESFLIFENFAAF